MSRARQGKRVHRGEEDFVKRVEQKNVRRKVCAHIGQKRRKTDDEGEKKLKVQKKFFRFGKADLFGFPSLFPLFTFSEKN